MTNYIHVPYHYVQDIISTPDGWLDISSDMEERWSNHLDFEYFQYRRAVLVPILRSSLSEDEDKNLVVVQNRFKELLKEEHTLCAAFKLSWWKGMAEMSPWYLTQHETIPEGVPARFNDYGCLDVYDNPIAAMRDFYKETDFFLSKYRRYLPEDIPLYIDGTRVERLPTKEEFSSDCYCLKKDREDEYSRLEVLEDPYL